MEDYIARMLNSKKVTDDIDNTKIVKSNSSDMMSHIDLSLIHI